MTLAELGWNETFAAAYEPWKSKADMRPGRVAIEFNQIFRVYVEDGELDAITAGRLKHRARLLPAARCTLTVLCCLLSDRSRITQ
jgi:hypothetical protein